MLEGRCMDDPIVNYEENLLRLFSSLCNYYMGAMSINFTEINQKQGRKAKPNKSGKSLTCKEGVTYPCGKICKPIGSRCNNNFDNNQHELQKIILGKEKKQNNTTPIDTEDGRSQKLKEYTEEIFKRSLHETWESGSYKNSIFKGKTYDELVKDIGEQEAKKVVESEVLKISGIVAKRRIKQEDITQEKNIIDEGNDTKLKRELQAFNRLYPQYKNSKTLSDFKSENPSVDLASELYREESLDKKLSLNSIMSRGSRLLETLEREFTGKPDQPDLLQVFKDFRDKLITNGLDLQEATKLIDSKTFDKSLDAKDRFIVAMSSTEFFQMTRGTGSKTLDKFKLDKDRAYADRMGKSVNIGFDTTPSVIWHELGHHFEFEDSRIEKAAKEWRDARAIDEAKKLNDLDSSRRYKESEYAKPDHFISAYVGKVYPDGSTEVVSMGLERFSSPELMAQLYSEDREHFKFILGLIKRD
jgi:hypothetical protein